MRCAFIKLLICSVIVNSLPVNTGWAEAAILPMPKPGVRISLSPPVNPPVFKGLTVDSHNPLRFEFILDQAEGQLTAGQNIQQESKRLAKYFLASLTTPSQDMWVNLSPYEKDRIIPSSFGQTQMGRDLLAQDYLLKQITSSLMYPEEELGKKFWERIYQLSQQRLGGNEIPVNTFNKVWILPQVARLYEKDNSVFIVEARLKVMLDQDYTATQNNLRQPGDMFQKEQQNVSSNSLPSNEVLNVKAPQVDKHSQNETIKQIIKEIIIPELEREINEGKNFAVLRQVYHSLVLAAWYKQKIKKSILAKVYVNQNKVKGTTYDDEQNIEFIYEQYIKAFKKGVFNYIKEEIDPQTQVMIPRKYFAGGLSLDVTPAMVMATPAEASEAMIGTKESQAVVIDCTQVVSKDNQSRPQDAAMKANEIPVDDNKTVEPSLLEAQYMINFTRELKQYIQFHGIDISDREQMIEDVLKMGKEIIPYLIDGLVSFSYDDLYRRVKRENNFQEYSYDYFVAQVLVRFGNDFINHMRFRLSHHKNTKFTDLLLDIQESGRQEFLIELLVEMDSQESKEIIERMTYLTPAVIRAQGKLGIDKNIDEIRQILRRSLNKPLLDKVVDSFIEWNQMRMLEAVYALARIGNEDDQRNIVDILKVHEMNSELYNMLINNITGVDSEVFKQYLMGSINNVSNRSKEFLGRAILYLNRNQEINDQISKIIRDLKDYEIGDFLASDLFIQFPEILLRILQQFPEYAQKVVTVLLQRPNPEKETLDLVGRIFIQTGLNINSFDIGAQFIRKTGQGDIDQVLMLTKANNSSVSMFSSIAAAHISSFNQERADALIEELTLNKEDVEFFKNLFLISDRESVDNYLPVLRKFAKKNNLTINFIMDLINPKHKNLFLMGMLKDMLNNNKSYDITIPLMVFVDYVTDHFHLNENFFELLRTKSIPNNYFDLLINIAKSPTYNTSGRIKALELMHNDYRVTTEEFANLINQIINETDPVQYESNEWERNALRTVAVSYLPKIRNSFEINERILKEEREDAKVRQQALDNLEIYSTTLTEESENDGSDRFIRFIKRIRKDRERKAIAQLQSEYAGPFTKTLQVTSQGVPSINVSLPNDVNDEQALERPLAPSIQHDSSKGELTPTPMQGGSRDNSFVRFLVKTTEKSKGQIEQELQARVLKQHGKIINQYGVIQRNTGDMIADQVFAIFDNLVKGYNQQAQGLGINPIKGKLFIVDSPQVNAFVFPGHQDVYIYMGWIIELAHWCKRRGEPLTEDIIAATLAHEMRHIMQQTAFEGLSFPDLSTNKLLANELLQLKREAEYDADSGAMMILGLSGYNPQVVLKDQEFSRDMTYHTVAETALTTHPHPKERIVYLQQILNTAKPIPGMTRPMKMIDQQTHEAILNWKGRHLGIVANRIHSAQDVIAHVANAQNMTQLVEALRVLRILGIYREPIVISRQSVVEDDIAREMFTQNIIDMMNTLVKPKVIELPKTSLPVAGTQGVLGQYLNAHEKNINEKFNQKRLEYFSKDKSVLRTMESLGAHFKNAQAMLMGQDIPIEQKTSILVQLQMIKQHALEKLINGFNQSQFYQRTATQEYLTESDWQDVVARARLMKDENDAQYIVDALAIKQFALFRRYGRKGLDQEFNAKDIVQSHASGVAQQLGIDSTDIKLGSIYLERSNEGFYSKDITTWPLETEQQRQQLIEAIALDHVLVIAGFEYQTHSDWSRFSIPDNIKKEVNDAVDRLSKNISSAWLNARGIQEHSYNEFYQWVKSFLIMRTNENWIDWRDIVNIKNQEEEVYKKALVDLVGLETDRLFSDVFISEIPAAASVQQEMFFSNNDFNQNKNAQYFELHNDVSGAVNSFMFDVNEAQSKGNLEFTRQYYQGMFGRFLRQFSFLFRKQIMVEMIVNQKEWMQGVFLPSELKEQLKGLMFDADIYSFVETFITDLLPKQVLSVGIDLGLMDQLENECAWIIKNRPHDQLLTEDFIEGYVNLRLNRLLYAKTKGNIVQYENMDELELSQTLEQLISKEDVFDILKDIADVGQWHMSMNSQSIVVNNKGKDRFLLAEVSQMNAEAWIEQARVKNKQVAIDLKSHQAPIFIFSRVPPKDVLSASTKQLFFRRLFDLNADQLSIIHKGQKDVMSQRVIKRGRISQGYVEVELGLLLDHLVITKVLEEYDSYPKINSHNFSNIISMKVLIGKKPYDGDFDPTEMATHIKHVFAHKQIAKRVIDVWSTITDRNTAVASAERIFKMINKIGIMGENSHIDQLAEEISRNSIGLLMFPYYADWMQEMQLPKIREESAQPSNERRSYLEAMVEAVDLEGPKAELFKKYDKEVLNLLSSDGSIDERLRILQAFLKKATLFRDGFIDTWERRLVPQVDLSAAQKIGLFVARQKAKGRIKNNYNTFETMALMTPLQWEKINAKQDNGNDIPLEVKSNNVEAVLDFYRKAIPLVADPQRQLRMGATAVKIYREANPQRRYHEEIEAIKEFFPFASEVRDSYIDELLERFEVGGQEDIPGVISKEAFDRIKKLYSIHQNVQYDQELTNANQAQQMVKALLSAASREDRVAILFWVLDSNTFPEPGLIKQLNDKLNLDFSELPFHVSILPESYRIKILENLFLGENGLFSPQNENDHMAMQDFTDKLFNHFFKEEGQGNNKSLDSFTRNLVKDLFLVVLKGYSPARRTSLVMGLLKDQKRFNRMVDGEKIAALLAALGPVGVKVGQILSENKTIIRDDELRSNLASLKSNAPAVNKAANLEMLEQSGINLNNIRLGRRLASASMKQVYEGWYKIADQWIEVVIKILRPNLERSINEDFIVFDDAMKFIKEKYGKDVQHLVKAIRHWIEIEKDFRNETANSRAITEVVNDFQEKNPSLPFRINVPQVLVGDKPEVMIEERVFGIEGSAVMEGRTHNKTWLKRTLESAGFNEKQVDSMMEGISKLNSKEITEWLRRLLLFMIFEDGRFHADLHSGNVMLGDEVSIIDLGLIEQFTEHQREGAKELMRGILVKNPNRIINAIKIIITQAQTIDKNKRNEISESIEQERSKMVKEMEKLFRRNLDVKHTMNELLAIVTSKRFEGVNSYANLMKALTTAIWLFPTNLNTANSTLSALSEAVGLSSKEKSQARMAYVFPLIKSEIGQMAVSWGQWPRLARIRARLNLWGDSWKQNMKSLMLGRWIFGQAEQIEKTLAMFTPTSIPSEESKVAVGTKQAYQTIGRIALVKKNEGEHELGSLEIEVDHNKVSELTNQAGFDAQQVSIFNEAIATLLKVVAVIRIDDRYKEKNIVGLNSQERWLLGKANSIEGQIQDNVLERTLAVLIMQHRYHNKGRKLTEKEAVALEAILPKQPSIRQIAQQMVKGYLLLLDENEDESGSLLEQLLSLRDDMKIKGYYWENNGVIKVSVGAHKPVSLQRVDTVDQEGVVNLQNVIDGSTIDKYQSLLRNELLPGKWEYVDLNMTGVKSRLMRTGFSNDGIFFLEIFSDQQQEFIKLRMTRDEFEKFLNGERSFKANIRQYKFDPIDINQWNVQGELVNKLVTHQPPSKKITKDTGNIANKKLRRNNTFPRKPTVPDMAMIGEKKSIKAISPVTEKKGGIDFNIDKVNLEIEREGASLELNHQAFEDMVIDGLEPIIIDIKPIHNLPAVFGLSGVGA